MDEPGERSNEEAWAMVAVMVGLGIVGAAIGFLLDSYLGTRPWLLLVGTLAGLGGGVVLAIHLGLAFARREERR